MSTLFMIFFVLYGSAFFFGVTKYRFPTSSGGIY